MKHSRRHASYSAIEILVILLLIFAGGWILVSMSNSVDCESLAWAPLESQPFRCVKQLLQP